MTYAIKKWGEVLQIINGKNQKAVANDQGKYPIYGSGGIIGRANDFLCEAGTTIIGRKGSINNPIFVNEPFWNVDTAFGIVPGEELLPKYLFYFCCLFDFRVLDKSTTIPSLTKRDLLAIKMPVPTLEEQGRIVGQIEELFSKLEKSVELLQIAKKKLTIYQQAVLKDAFEEATSETTMQLTINELLTKERKGISTGPFGTMLKKYEYQIAGIPVLGIDNIGEGKFEFGYNIFVTKQKADELKAFELRAGDIIISRSGTVGELCVVPLQMDGALLSTNLMRISLNREIILPEYFVSLFRSKGIVVDQIKELCKGSTRMFLNQAILKQIIFPVPSIETQKRIVDIIESRLFLCNSIEQTIDTALRKANIMRQSILCQAFSGKTY